MPECSIVPGPFTTCVQCSCSQLANRPYLTSLDVHEYGVTQNPEPGSLYGSMAMIAELPALSSQLRQLTLRVARGVTEQHLAPLGMMTGLEHLTVQPGAQHLLAVPSCISRLIKLHTVNWHAGIEVAGRWQQWQVTMEKGKACKSL
eukprot:jgi/Chrzof1/11106/Cz05g24010.t1